MTPTRTTPLVSIITPSLNQGGFLRDTIESVLAQTHPRIEHIVIDGGSTDQTLAILTQYGERVKWISEPDRGQAHAINKGFRMASGEIVAWVNSDDMLLPEAAAHAVAAFAGDPEAGFIFGNAYRIDEHGEPLGRIEIENEPDAWLLANGFDYVAQPSAFFRAAAVREVGGLDESYRWAMDWEIFIRLSLRFDTVRIPEFLSFAREYDATKTRSGGFARLAEIYRLLDTYADGRSASAYRLYTVEALAMIAERAVRRTAASAGLSPRLPQRIMRRPQAKLEQLVARAGDWHADGWVGRRLRRHERRRGDVLVLSGEIPPLYEQRLDVIWDGRRIARCRLAPGCFTLCTPIVGDTRQRARLEVRASRSFVARRRGLSRDSRRLSFRLESIGWSRRAETTVWRDEGRFSDGWAAPRVRRVMRRDGVALRIAGRVHSLSRQTITIFCDGRRLSAYELDEGPFELLAAVPSVEPLLRLELRAGSTLELPERPARKVGYLLEDISWSS